MIKKPEMGTQINRKVWVTVTDILRFATPIMCAVITTLTAFGLHTLNGYEEKQRQIFHAQDNQSKSLNEINTKLAVLLERESFSAARTEEARVNLDALTKVANKNASDIQVIYARLNK